MEGVFEHYNLPVGAKRELRDATLSTFEFSSKKDPFLNIRSVRDGGSMFYVSDGKYVRLHVNGQLMMTDTGMERKSNLNFVRKANGKVLIAGLGIGLIIKNILPKLVSGEITEITIIEKYQSVIDLISPYFRHEKIKIICADIFEWMPIKDEKYDTIYFDIWPEICTDNLDEIKTLHNKFKNKLNKNNPSKWMNSWMKEYLQGIKRKERNQRYW